MPRLAAIVVSLATAVAFAQAPARLGYQGRLLGADGNAAVGVVDVTFTLYDAELSGNLLWQELQHVPLTDGFYAVSLGDATPLPATAFDGGERFLELAVGGNVLTPRQRVDAVPYALSASAAATASALLGRPLGTVPPADGQVLKFDAASGKWAPGAVAVNPGTVTGVSASAPLSVTNGTSTPAISLGTVGAANGGTGLTASTGTNFLRGDGSGAWTAGSIASGDLPTFSGDVTGASNATTIASLQGKPITLTGLVGGDVLAYDATNGWLPAPGGVRIASGGGITGGTVALGGSLTLGTSAGGDLSGALNAAKVLGVQGVPVSATAPTDGQVLKYSAASGKWSPGADAVNAGTVTSVSASAPLSVANGASTPAISLGTVGAANGGTGLTASSGAKFLRGDGSGGWTTGGLSASDLPTLGGDVTGSFGANTVTSLRGAPVSVGGLVPGDVLAYGSGGWAPAIGGVVVTAGAGLSGGGPVALGGSISLVNAGVLSLSGGGGVTVSASTGALTLGTRAGGDLSGPLGNATVTGLQGVPVGAAGPTAHQFLREDGSGGWKAGAVLASDLPGVFVDLTSAQSVGGAKTFTSPVTAPSFVGDGSALTGLAAGALASGVVPDARLGANVPRLNASATQTFAGPLVASAFAGDGSGLTNLSASALGGGTLADARLGPNVALYNAASPTFANTLAAASFSTPGSVTAGKVIGDGSALSNLSASALASGTVADARLSSNVALLSGAPSFTGNVGTSGRFVGSGAGLTNLPAASLTGSVADSLLSTNVALYNAASPTFANALTAASFSTSGNVTVGGAGKFSGSGAGLTNVPTSSLTGGLADALLSTNIPRLNASGAQTFAGPLAATAFAGDGSALTNVKVAVAGGALTGNGQSASPITLSQANGSTSGYLASGDWTAFNGKVASVSAGAGLTSSGAATSPTLSAAFAGQSCAAGSSVTGFDASGNVVCQAQNLLPSLSGRVIGVTAIGTATAEGFQMWVTVPNMVTAFYAAGGPVQINLSIPLSGGSTSTCRPTIDGAAAGAWEPGADLTYIWQEGLSYTGGGWRMWNSHRMYQNVPQGLHMLAVQCQTDSGAASQTANTSMTQTMNVIPYGPASSSEVKAYAGSVAGGATVGDSNGWVTVPGLSVPFTSLGGPVRIMVSVPITGGNNHNSCTPLVDGNPAGQGDPLDEPTYYWEDGLVYGINWNMYNRDRVYLPGVIPAGSHTATVRCHGDGSGTTTVGNGSMAIGLGVVAYKQASDPTATVKVYIGEEKHQYGYGSGWTSLNASATGTGLNGVAFTSTGGPVEIGVSLPLESGSSNTCRVLVDGLAPVRGEPDNASYFWQEGIVYTLPGWAVWDRSRVYHGLAAGSHTMSVQCQTDSGTGYAGHPDMISTIYAISYN